jgi:CheY-like chemotaxis protein
MDLTRAHVIVVEDNADTRLIVADLFDDIGVASCLTVESGRALAAHCAKKPALHADLILIDLQMPGEDGCSVARWLRSKPQFANSLMIAFTAAMTHEAKEAAFQAGFDGFIGKSLQAADFIDLIHRIFAGEAVWSRERMMPIDPYRSNENADFDQTLRRLEPKRRDYARRMLPEVEELVREWTGLTDGSRRNESLRSILQSAHTLAGSSSTLGFARFTRAASDVEIAIRTAGYGENRSLTGDDIDQIGNALKTLREAAHTMLEEPPIWSDVDVLHRATGSADS